MLQHHHNQHENMLAEARVYRAQMREYLDVIKVNHATYQGDNLEDGYDILWLKHVAMELAGWVDDVYDLYADVEEYGLMEELAHVIGTELRYEISDFKRWVIQHRPDIPYPRVEEIIEELVLNTRVSFMNWRNWWVRSRDTPSA